MKIRDILDQVDFEGLDIDKSFMHMDKHQIIEKILEGKHIA